MGNDRARTQTSGGIAQCTITAGRTEGKRPRGPHRNTFIWQVKKRNAGALGGMEHSNTNGRVTVANGEEELRTRQRDDGKRNVKRLNIYFFFLQINLSRIYTLYVNVPFFFFFITFYMRARVNNILFHIMLPLLTTIGNLCSFENTKRARVCV